MPTFKKTKKYQKFQEFVEEMEAKGIFEKIKDIPIDSSIEWKEGDITWRISNKSYFISPDVGFEEYRLSHFNELAGPITKKEWKKQKISKTCWIYREPFETTDKYTFNKRGLCITGIDLKSISY
jgi:hypothetical protein